MLGVRREAVTEAAGKLQTAGLIQYRRGHIMVADGSGLEGRACECYGMVKSEYDRLFCLTPANLSRHRARPNPTTLRKRAEARWKQAPPTTPSAPWNTERLVHELFHEEMLEAKTKKKCEIVLIVRSQRPEAIVRIEAVPDDTGRVSHGREQAPA